MAGVKLGSILIQDLYGPISTFKDPWKGNLGFPSMAGAGIGLYDLCLRPRMHQGLTLLRRGSRYIAIKAFYKAQDLYRIMVVDP